MSSTTAGRHRMRCGRRNCRTRFTLKRHPDKYKRIIKCPVCKRTTVHSVEKERRAERERNETCNCNFYPFPHRKGTLRMCEYHKLANVEPTQEEIYDYQGCLDTPRSGFC